MKAWWAGLALMAVGVTGSVAATAQSAPSGFRFGPPTGGFSIRVGYMTADASSDVFAFAVDEWMLSKRDFGGGSVEAELNIAATDAFDFVFGAGISRSSTRTESRKWEGIDDLPIEQVTSFTRVPLTAGIRIHVTELGRRVGSFAWIPNRFVVHAGGGVGIIPYEFKQDGDFVDFETLEVFSDTFKSEGWAALWQLTLGADYSLSPRMALTAQARYGLASAPMGSDWSGFENIDLSGKSVTAGLHFRF